MSRSIGSLVGILVVLLAGARAQAALQLVANFDGMSGTVDGQTCNGVLGAFLDTESENTGNVTFQTVGGSVTVRVTGHSSGTLSRAVGVGGINNPIDKGETGVGFFRFNVATGNTVRSHMGLLSDTGTNPVNSTNDANPKTVPAGFRLVDNGTGFDLVTLDGATVLQTGLARSQWYNVWIVADHTAETFDLYVSKAPGPAGAPTLPTAADLVQSGLPFMTANTGALNGMIVACPAGTAGAGAAAGVYVDEIWWDGDQGLTKVIKARNPSPADGQQDVARDVVLSWTAGLASGTHDVYFGTSADDVGNADRSKPLGVLASQGQDANSFDPAGLLAIGQTYYWRVDEVNVAPGAEVFKGSVWSFTVEPVAYALKNITATASGSAANMGPEKTIDGSGLTADGLHGATDTTMWLSDGAKSPWIQYVFDNVYQLQEMWVWNSNQSLEPAAGLGAKDVTVEYSVDGVTWTTLAGVPAFARAPGVGGYAHNTTVAFNGVVAKYVRLTINSNWGGIMPQTGLSEVRFYYIPVLPREPSPATGQTGVAVDAGLRWRAGREAASHQVYFSTDRQAVADGTAPVRTVSDSSFDPGPLNLGTTYYWKVAEVNNAQTPSVWRGDVWSFSTQEYIVVEDFESYDQDNKRIYDTWIDGATDGLSGSFVGYNPTAAQLAAGAHFAETVIVHGGKQSMPVEYNNVATPFYSEATRTFETAQNWTGNGADTLSLWFRGRAVGFVEEAGGITMSGAGTDIWNAADQFRFAAKQLNGNGAIVAKVESIASTDAWAKVGVMIRESLDPGARFAAVYATPGNGVRYQARLLNAAAATSDSVLPATALAEEIALKTPIWIKIERVGSTFNGYYSADGTTWTAMPWNATPVTISMASSAYIGLAVTGHGTGTAVGVVSNVSTTGGVTGPWDVEAIGVAQPTNDAAPLCVTVQDNAGKSKTIVHPDSAATNSVTWQQWRIALSDISAGGVKLSSVKKLIIGIGDRTSPKPGGAGLIFLDDIGFGHPASQ